MLTSVQNPELRRQVEAHRQRQARIAARSVVEPAEPVALPANVVTAMAASPRAAVLRDELFGPSIWLFRAPTGSEIIDAVCDITGISRVDLISERRTRNIVIPRQVGMAACCQWTGLSTPIVGRLFGKRDHTTVLHARNTAIALMYRGDADVVELVSRLSATLHRTWEHPHNVAEISKRFATKQRQARHAFRKRPIRQRAVVGQGGESAGLV